MGFSFSGANLYFSYFNRFCLKKRQSSKQAQMGSNMEEVHGPDASQPFLGESEPKAKWQQTQVQICKYY